MYNAYKRMCRQQAVPSLNTSDFRTAMSGLQASNLIQVRLCGLVGLVGVVGEIVGEIFGEIGWFCL